jgi:hypothetical protein
MLSSPRNPSFVAIQRVRVTCVQAKRVGTGLKLAGDERRPPKEPYEGRHDLDNDLKHDAQLVAVIDQ